VKKRRDLFRLFDLRITVEKAKGGRMVCNHPEGATFELSGENLSFPPGQTFPLYPLATILPLLPAKQRSTHANDWMTTDAVIACPDPHCAGRFRIERTTVRVFDRAHVTVVKKRPARPASRRPSRGGASPPR
jgi:uncharacterized repeat protein (TIGR04076 family)